MPPSDLSSLLDGKPVRPTVSNPFLWRAYIAARISEAIATSADDPAAAHARIVPGIEAEFRAAFPGTDPGAIFHPA